MATLTVRVQGQEDQCVSIEADCVVGREPDCDICLDCPEVSRHHACIQLADGDYVVKDLDSRNGTTVNAIRVASVTLNPGDVIRMGPYELVYDAEADPGPGGQEQSARTTMDQVAVLASLPVDASEIVARQEALDPEVLRRRLRVFTELGRALSAQPELNALGHAVLDELLAIFPRCRMAALRAELPRTDPLEISRARSMDAEVVPSRTVVEHTMKSGEALLCADAREDDLLSKAKSVAEFHLRSIMCTPLTVGVHTLGVLYVDAGTGHHPFTTDDLEVLTGIALQVAMALHNLYLHIEQARTERLAAVGETFAGLAHCIKNVLGGVQGGVFIVDKALKRQQMDRLEKGWDMVKRNTAFMEDLVLNMLSYCKQRTPRRESLDLNDLIESVAMMVDPKAKGTGVAIACTQAPEPITVELDKVAMQRALMNLLGNAVEACAAGTGRVEISAATERAGATAVVRVADNGNGIKPEDQEKLFTLFFSTKGSKGTGLGLSVVHKIIQEHGGKVSVQSEWGTGTTFEVRLPVEFVEEPTITSM